MDDMQANAPENHLAITQQARKGWLATVIIILIIIGAAFYVLSAFTSLNILGLNKSSLANAWKAVFLTNGQVYFGHVVKETSDPVVVRDIYYLQVIQPLQQLGEGQNAPRQTQPQLSLVKLGNELHGPMDEMRINREQLLFIESLKDDGRVVQAINAYIAGQK